MSKTGIVKSRTFNRTDMGVFAYLMGEQLDMMVNAEQTHTSPYSEGDVAARNAYMLDVAHELGIRMLRDARFTPKGYTVSNGSIRVGLTTVSYVLGIHIQYLNASFDILVISEGNYYIRCGNDAGETFDGCFKPSDIHFGGASKIGESRSIGFTPGNGYIIRKRDGYQLSLCPGTCSRTCKGCYAKTTSLIKKWARYHYDANTVIDSINPYLVGEAIKTRTYGGELFRLNESGDFPSLETARHIFAACDARRDVTFWGYTKKYELINRLMDERIALGLEPVPANLCLYFSVPFHGDPDAIPNPHGLPIAMTLFNGDECPDGFTVCPACGRFEGTNKYATVNHSISCDECGLCVRMRENIAFLFHK